MKTKSLIFVLILVFYNGVFAQWTPTAGPQGGTVWYILNYNNFVFSSVSWAGIFRTSNSGLSWEVKNTGLYLDNPKITAIGIFENRILVGGVVGGENRLFMSTDNGNSWCLFGNSIPNVPPRTVSSITSKGTYLFVAIPSYGIYRSSDYGASWVPVNTGLPNYSIADIKTAGNAIIAACSDSYFGGIFRSTDNGNNWERTLGTNMSFSAVECLCVDENNPNRIFGAGYTRGVYMSTNNGVNWSSLYGPSDACSIAFSDPYLFAGTIWSGIFRTTNFGTNWTVVNSGLPGTKVTTLMIHSGTVYAGTEYWGIYKSTNWGVNWEEANSGVNGREIQCMKESNNVMYVGTFKTWLYKSTDFGQSWEFKNSGMFASIVNALAIKNNYVYAGTSDYSFGRHGVYISSNGGDSWRFADSTYECEALAVVGNYIFAGTQNMGLRRSTDNGFTWSYANNGLPITHIKGIAVIDTLVFVTGYGQTGGGVYRTTNKGDLWLPITNGLPGSAPDCIKPNGQNLYLSVGSSKFYSSNYGDNWIQLGNSGSAFVDFEFYQNHIFGASSNGIYHSSDNGYHWRQRNDGLLNRDVSSLVCKNGYLYAALDGGSVWKISIPDIIGIQNISSRVPAEFRLYQNYPNPFNPITNIEFDIPTRSYVRLVIYDITGREVETIVNEELNSGSYRVKFDGSRLNSGVYFYRLTAGNYTQTGKMVLIK